MKITEHFDEKELSQPAKHGLSEMPYPEKWLLSRGLPLCKTLEDIRQEFKLPVKLLSVFRSEAYNKAIGGARNSQHVQGRAADFIVKGISPDKVHAKILELYNEGKLPQLGGLGKYPTFTHIDIRPKKNGRLSRWEGTRTSS